MAARTTNWTRLKTLCREYNGEIKIDCIGNNWEVRFTWNPNGVQAKEGDQVAIGNSDKFDAALAECIEGVA